VTVPSFAVAIASFDHLRSPQFLATGQFALETHVEEIALAMKQFLAKKVS
jgi:hypothetical protein